MLPDMGVHATFIWASYAAVFGVLVIYGTWLVLEGRSLERRLSEFEQRRGGQNAQSISRQDHNS